ncbi:hypothetical protein C8R44DRAFT_987738 [Mycena epipterygia]|nr:hypothetical protein C8R44DRAFT_987738 [Mycena epipterygia]
MPIELPSASPRQTPVPTTEGTLPTASNTIETTLAVVRDADTAGTATDDLLLAETLRDCLASLPQSSLLSPPPELNDDSERSPSSITDQSDQANEQEPEVVQIAKLLRRSLYIMAGLGDPLGVYQNSSSEDNAPFATDNNVTEILRDGLYAVLAMQTILDQRRALEVDSPNVETSSNPEPQTTSKFVLGKVTLAQLMDITNGPPWGNDLMKPLCEALYTEPFEENNTTYLVCIAESYLIVAYSDNAVKTPEEYISRIQCLVGFLEQTRGNGTVTEFLDIVRAQIPGWTLGEKEYTNVLYGFWVLFHSPMWTPDSGATFRNKIDAIFPPLKKHRQSLSFSVTLSDIFAAGLEVYPTHFIHEHLLITGNEVKIFCPSVDQIKALGKFATNRAAIALGIGSLGEEIFCSLYMLYGKKKEFDRARSFQLLPKDNQESHEFFLTMALERYAVIKETKPQVLASRVLALNSLIRYRRSWVVSLIRDMKNNQREQPFLFWGSIVAFLFGICTVIQTVASVWSLQLALVAS